MQGHAYCQALFDDVFLPILQAQFPNLLPHLSAGVIGLGSDVLGADDTHSRDHDWGPCKCQLFLPESDVKQHSTDISRTLKAALPDTFQKITTSKLHPNEIRINTIDAAYENAYGFSHPPTTLEAWASADANALCYAASGFLIYDPSGALAKRMAEFQSAYYPTDVWKWHIATQLWDIWHYGDYNGANRLAKRGDGVGLLVGQGYFVESTLKLLCLLNKRFPVYWKWSHWQVQKLPKWMDVLGPKLQELEAASNLEIRSKTIHKICETIRDILSQMNLLPDAKWRNFMGSTEILQQIESAELKKIISKETPHLDVW